MFLFFYYNDLVVFNRVFCGEGDADGAVRGGAVYEDGFALPNTADEGCMFGADAGVDGAAEFFFKDPFLRLGAFAGVVDEALVVGVSDEPAFVADDVEGVLAAFLAEEAHEEGGADVVPVFDGDDAVVYEG